jgi:hypothetical protein
MYANQEMPPEKSGALPTMDTPPFSVSLGVWRYKEGENYAREGVYRLLGKSMGMAPTYFDGPQGRGDQRPVFTAYRSLREWLSESVLRPHGAMKGHKLKYVSSMEPTAAEGRNVLTAVIGLTLSFSGQK